MSDYCLLLTAKQKGDTFMKLQILFPLDVAFDEVERNLCAAQTLGFKDDEIKFSTDFASLEWLHLLDACGRKDHSVESVCREASRKLLEELRIEEKNG